MRIEVDQVPMLSTGMDSSDISSIKAKEQLVLRKDEFSTIKTKSHLDTSIAKKRKQLSTRAKTLLFQSINIVTMVLTWYVVSTYVSRFVSARIITNIIEQLMPGARGLILSN